MGLAETAEKKLNYLADNIIYDFIKQRTVHTVDQWFSNRVSRHICVSPKFSNVSTELKMFLNYSKQSIPAIILKVFADRFAHCPYVISFSLHKRDYSVVSCFFKLNLVG
jgi:hypothetical protein